MAIATKALAMRVSPSFSEGKFSFMLYREVDGKRRHDQNGKISLVHCSSLLPLGRFHALTSTPDGSRHMPGLQRRYTGQPCSISGFLDFGMLRAINPSHTLDS